jgi:hypothetical protein
VCGFSATTLTGFHFAVTALVGLVSNATGYSASKHVPLWELFWFSIVANMSITGMNFSLMLNSVGFYQVWLFADSFSICALSFCLHQHIAHNSDLFVFFFWHSNDLVVFIAQISKLSMIPVVCILEWIIHNKNYSREVKMAVMVVVIGVGVCTVTDVKVNLKGFICACVAVLSTSLQQIVSISVIYYSLCISSVNLWYGHCAWGCMSVSITST